MEPLLKFISYTRPAHGAAEEVRVNPVEPISFHQSRQPMSCAVPERGGVADDFHYADDDLPSSASLHE